MKHPFVLGSLSCSLFLALTATEPASAQGTQVNLGDLTVSPTRLPDIAAHDEIPVDTSGWAVVPYVGPPTGAGVNAAIDAMAPQSILVLPDGIYTGHLEMRRSEAVVRGNCQDPAAVRWQNNGNPQNLLFSGPLCDGGASDGNFCWAGDVDCPGGSCDASVAGTMCTASWLQLCGADTGDHLTDLLSPPYAWTGPYTRGTTSLAITGAGDFSAGDVVWISSDVLPGPDENIQTDDFNWMAEVVAASNQRIVLDAALPIDFNAAGPNGPQVRRFTKILRDSGVECMTLDHQNPQDPAGLYQNINLSIRYAWNVWVSDVDLGDTFNNHALVERTGRAVLTGNRFGEQHKSLVGDGQTCGGPVATNPCWNKQAIVFSESHRNSFIDNIVEASIGVEIAHSSSANWIAYNYFPEPTFHPSGEPRRALFPHGNYGYANVLEGNVFWGAGEMDVVWGSQGPRYVWFRNVAVGPLARFSNEAWAGAPDPFRLSRDATYLLNYGRLFGYQSGDEIDTRSDAMHLERNVFTEALHTGDPTGNGTVTVANFDAGAGPLAGAWDLLRFPSTLNREVSGEPDFWCTSALPQATPVCPFDIEDGIGAFWDDTCLLPAQARSLGVDCSLP